MSNLIIDIGNTAVKASRSDGMTIGKTFRYQGEKVRDFILSLTAEDRPEVMVIASAYAISPSDENLFEKECGHLVLLDSAHTDLLKEKALPQYLSYDRAAALVAARYLFRGRGCTLFDFGTTFTVDFIDAEGRYEGGNISLGCRTRFRALNRYSRSLPLLDTPDETPDLGQNLTSSINGGIVTGIMFEIDGYSARHPENVLIFTGGDAIYFAKRTKKSIFAICNLVLMGLAIIADEYVKKNQ